MNNNKLLLTKPSKAYSFIMYMLSPTLQRHCTENWEQTFPDMKLRGLVLKSYILVSVSNLYSIFRSACLAAAK
jgi:hypothetical protein